MAGVAGELVPAQTAGELAATMVVVPTPVGVLPLLAPVVPMVAGVAATTTVAHGTVGVAAAIGVVVAH